MLICKACGATFEEPARERGESIGPWSEEWEACPACGDVDFCEAKICDCCGQYVDELHDDLNQCKVCVAHAYKEIRDMVEESDPRKRKYVREVYDYLLECAS